MTFRTWLQNIYIDNCEEHDAWGEPRISIRQYFDRYKWWLRREYRFQMRNENQRQSQQDL
jgi:hypothetical protein